MTETFSGLDCLTLALNMAVAIRAHESWLTSLDSEVGDGDHGTNIARAMAEVEKAIGDLENPTPFAVWNTVGATLMNEMGGAAGVIFGSFFRGGARAVRGKETLGLSEMASFLELGLAEVLRRGKANPGDKTLVDALAPATKSLRESERAHQTMEAALRKMALASQKGALATTSMTAQTGRAKFLGARSVGFQDAGATSMAIILSSWAGIGFDPVDE